ncbi:MAG: hypothetical protein OXI16_09880 [Chloroflexota bacterium]|nr:hypothetical protein [Chloroflexota bacterium]
MAFADKWLIFISKTAFNCISLTGGYICPSYKQLTAPAIGKNIFILPMVR